MRSSISSDIEILGPFAKKKIPDCASDNVSLVTIVDQLPDHVNGIGVNCAENDTMFFAGVDFCFSD